MSWTKIGEIVDKHGVIRDVMECRGFHRVLYHVVDCNRRTPVAQFGDYLGGYWEISVRKDWRHRGLATTLLNFIEQHTDRKFEAGKLTPMGKLWWISLDRESPKIISCSERSSDLPGGGDA